MQNLLWNHSYSGEPILVDCQNFTGSWGCNFVGNWFVALLCKTIHYLVKCSWGHNETHEHQTSINNDDSIVYEVWNFYQNSVSSKILDN